jgi:hypothetical protein
LALGKFRAILWNVRGASGLVRRWLGAFVLVAVACVDSEPIVEEGEQEQAFCEANCRRAFQCNLNSSLERCQTYCEAEVTGLACVRPVAMQLITECIIEVPCASFLDEDSFEPCWDRAGRDVEPIQKLRSFCQAWSRRWFECGAHYPIDDCEDDWSIYHGWFLDRNLACTTSACADFAACTQAVSGDP